MTVDRSSGMRPELSGLTRRESGPAAGSAPSAKSPMPAEVVRRWTFHNAVLLWAADTITEET